MKEKNCERCGGTGVIEIMGDGAHFEWDVVDTRPCDCGVFNEAKRLEANEIN